MRADFFDDFEDRAIPSLIITASSEEEVVDRAAVQMRNAARVELDRDIFLKSSLETNDAPAAGAGMIRLSEAILVNPECWTHSDKRARRQRSRRGDRPESEILYLISLMGKTFSCSASGTALN
jgi:hypothetical protein